MEWGICIICDEEKGSYLVSDYYPNAHLFLYDDRNHGTRKIETLREIFHVTVLSIYSTHIWFHVEPLLVISIFILYIGILFDGILKVLRTNHDASLNLPNKRVLYEFLANMTINHLLNW